MIEVRPATEGDVPRILELLSQLFERDLTKEAARATSLRRLLDSDRGAVLVAFDGDQVHGVITFSCNLAVRFDIAYAQIEELVVDDAARGKKAGAALVRAAMSDARARGCEEMGLYRVRPLAGSMKDSGSSTSASSSANGWTERRLPDCRHG